MRRWKRRGTWLRIGGLFACYLLLPALMTAAIGLGNASDLGMVAFILMPIVFFVVPMLIFFNESALIYGAIYSVLAVTANKIGSSFHSKSHITNSPRES